MHFQKVRAAVVALGPGGVSVLNALSAAGVPVVAAYDQHASAPGVATAKGLGAAVFGVGQLADLFGYCEAQEGARTFIFLASTRTNIVKTTTATFSKRTRHNCTLLLMGKHFPVKQIGGGEIRQAISKHISDPAKLVAGHCLIRISVGLSPGSPETAKHPYREENNTAMEQRLLDINARYPVIDHEISRDGTKLELVVSAEQDLRGTLAREVVQADLDLLHLGLEVVRAEPYIMTS